LDELQKVSEEAQVLLARIFSEHLTPAARQVFVREANDALDRIGRKLDDSLGEVVEAADGVKVANGRVVDAIQTNLTQQAQFTEALRSTNAGLVQMREDTRVATDLLKSTTTSMQVVEIRLATLESRVEAILSASSKLPADASKLAVAGLQPVLDTVRTQQDSLALDVAEIGNRLEAQWGRRIRFLQWSIFVELALLTTLVLFGLRG